MFLFEGKVIPCGKLTPSPGLDLQQLGFLVLQQLVHLGDIGVGELVELGLSPAAIVLALVTAS